jgi:hypothetical protein
MTCVNGHEQRDPLCPACRRNARHAARRKQRWRDDPEYRQRHYERRYQRYRTRLYANPVYAVRQMRRKLNGLSRRLDKVSPERARRKSVRQMQTRLKDLSRRLKYAHRKSARARSNARRREYRKAERALLTTLQETGWLNERYEFTEPMS